jgi:hypothetical protein
LGFIGIFSTIIVNAISGYFGMSGSEQVKDILTIYNQIHTVTSEIVDE